MEDRLIIIVINQTHVTTNSLSVCKQTIVNNFPQETPQMFKAIPLLNPLKLIFNHSQIEVFYRMIRSSRRKRPISIPTPNNQIIAPTEERGTSITRMRSRASIGIKDVIDFNQGNLLESPSEHTILSKNLIPT